MYKRGLRCIGQALPGEGFMGTLTMYQRICMVMVVVVNATAMASQLEYKIPCSMRVLQRESKESRGTGLDGLSAVPFYHSRQGLNDVLWDTLDPMPPELINIILGYDGREFQGECIETFTGYGDKRVNYVVSLGDRRFVTLSADGVIRLLDLNPNAPYGMKTLAHYSDVFKIVSCEELGLFASASRCGEIMLWTPRATEIEAKKMVCIKTLSPLGLDGRLDDILACKDGLVCCADGVLHLWDWKSAVESEKAEARKLVIPQELWKSSMFASMAYVDQGILALSKGNGECLLADLSASVMSANEYADLRVIAHLKEATSSAAMLVLPEKLLLTSTIPLRYGKRVKEEQFMHLWQLYEGKQPQCVQSFPVPLYVHKTPKSSCRGKLGSASLSWYVPCCSAYVGHGLLAVGSDDGTIRLFDCGTGKCIKEAKTGSPVTCLCYLREIGYLVSGHEDGWLKVWH